MKEIQKLIEDHWNYINDLLYAHGQSKEIIEIVEFHYKTAFEHGWKHAIEDIEIKEKQQENIIESYSKNL